MVFEPWGKSHKKCFFFEAFGNVLHLFICLCLCVCACMDAMVCMEISEQLVGICSLFVCVVCSKPFTPSLLPAGISSFCDPILFYMYIMALLISGRAWCNPGWPWTHGVALVLEPLILWPPSPKGSATSQPAHLFLSLEKPWTPSFQFKSRTRSSRESAPSPCSLEMVTMPPTASKGQRMFTVAIFEKRDDRE